MYVLSVENMYGEVLHITENDAYTITSVTGLNPPAATINTAAVSTSDGSMFNSARISVRNLVITIAIVKDVEKNRIQLYKYFKQKQYTKIYYKNDSRDVFIEGYIETFECDLFDNGETAQISILCPQPFFKSVDQMIIDFSSVEPGLEFEEEFPEEGIEFSVLNINTRQTIVNDGDVECGFIMELSALGPVTNPIIYNVDTRESFKINFEMKTSDVIRINTNSGEKSIRLIRDGDETNILNYLGRGASWFKLKSGDNVFTYECESGFEFLQFKVIHVNRFEGV